MSYLPLNQELRNKTEIHPQKTKPLSRDKAIHRTKATINPDIGNIREEI